jgi:uncharacterized protein (TIGR02118 family)
MPVKLIALYRQPDNEAAFMAHYENVHTPLVLAVPDLQKLTVNKVQSHLFGPDKLFMIVEMSYPDKETFDAAMASPENKATGKDAMTFAKDIISLMIVEESA